VIRSLFIWLAMGVLCSTPITSEAHRYHLGQVEVSRNSSAGTIEFVHQYFTHDFEHALPKLDDKALATYFEKNFVIEYNGERLPLAFVGSETDIGTTYVYHELSAIKLPKGESVDVKYSVLVQEIDGQTNTLTVLDDSGEGTSYTFDSMSTQKVVLP